MPRALQYAPILLALLAVSATASSGSRLQPTCLRPADGATVVRFRTADGARLAGVVLGRGPAGVVLAHQLYADLCQWVPFARVLAKRGYRVLAFDFRGYGSSVPGRQNVNLDRDAAGAAAELRRRGARRIVLVGASMGGTAVLVAGASVKPRVAAVISLSGAIQIFGLDALAAVERVSAPVLLAAATSDAGAAEDARSLHSAAASKTKRLVIVPGSRHGVDLLPVGRVRIAVLGFIAAHTR